MAVLIRALARALPDLARATRAIGKGPHPLADLRWLCWALACRAALGPAKRLVALPRLVRLVRWSAGAAESSHGTCTRTDLIGDWFARYSPLLPANCLERSLIVFGTWSSVGIPVELHVGFRRAGTATEGHTWVTARGVLLLEPRQHVAPFESTCVFDEGGVHATTAA